jgi:peptide/nickel transport system substrate-binding protein
MKRRKILTVTPAAFALLAACGPAQEATPKPTTAAGGATTAPSQPTTAANAAGKPVQGGTLTAAMSRDATNFDPIFQNDVYSAVVLNQVVDTLYEIDKDGKAVGRLVEKTDNPSPNVYVMSIRKGIKFHDGTDMNAEAVRFNLQRHLDNQKSVRYGDVRDITSMEVTDPYTIKITLKQAFAPFPVKLTGGAGYILSPAAVQKLGDTLARDLTGAGSGPYKFTQWQKDTQVVVDRNTSYWKKDSTGGALPYLDKIIFKPIPDENVRLTNLKTGDADVLIANPPNKDVADLKKDPSLEVKQIPGIGWQFITLNTQKAPFNKPEVRRALAYAIDRDAITKTVFFGNGESLDTPIPKTIPWAYDSSPASHPYLKQDVNKAKSELQAAGVTAPVKFSFQISNASPELQSTAELIKDQIKAAGFDMDIQLIEFATVVSNAGSGNYDAAGIGWSGDVDADTIYTLFSTGLANNFSKYSNPDVDKLLNDGRATTDLAKRGDIYKQIVKILNQDEPWVIYYNTPQISTVRKNVQNYPQTYNGYWGTRDFETMWKTK